MLKKLLIANFLLLTFMSSFADDLKSERAILKNYESACNKMNIKELQGKVSKHLYLKLRREFHGFRKSHLKPEYNVAFLSGKLSSNKKMKIIYALRSLKVNGKYDYRNERYQFIIKEGVIESVNKASDQGENFWDAAFKAKTYAVISRSDKQKPEVSLIEILGGSKPPKDLKFSSLMAYQMMPGKKYLCPLVETKGALEAERGNFEPIEFSTKNSQKILKAIDDYKTVSSLDEKAFLRKILSQKTLSPLWGASIRRLAECCEFEKQMSDEQLDFWKKFLFEKSLSLRNKIFILENLASHNFEKARSIYDSALKDSSLTSTAAFIYARYDKKAFAEKMLAWLGNPRERNFALKNAALLVNNKAFVSKAMKYFNPNDKKSLSSFISVLIADNSPESQKIIKSILIQGKNPFLCSSIINAIWKNGDSAYSHAVLSYLKKNKPKNRFDMSRDYALAYLLRVKNKEGIKILYGNLKSQEKDKNSRMHSFYLFHSVLDENDKAKIKNIDELEKYLNNYK